MDRPRVVIHSLVSLEGRLDGFPADVGLYYELASRLPHQAVLTGSGTMLAAAASEGIDLSEEDPEPLSAITSPVAASTISTCSRRASRGRLPARRGECQDREPDAATACNSDSGASRCAVSSADSAR